MRWLRVVPWLVLHASLVLIAWTTWNGAFRTGAQAKGGLWGIPQGMQSVWGLLIWNLTFQGQFLLRFLKEIMEVWNQKKFEQKKISSSASTQKEARVFHRPGSFLGDGWRCPAWGRRLRAGNFDRTSKANCDGARSEGSQAEKMAL